MICRRCRDAADMRLDRSAHCCGAGGPGTSCSCQHKTERYRPRPHREPQPEAGPEDTPCRAQLRAYGAEVQHCSLIAGHYDESDEPDVHADPPHPGGWHIGPADVPARATWADKAIGATADDATHPLESP